MLYGIGMVSVSVPVKTNHWASPCRLRGWTPLRCSAIMLKQKGENKRQRNSNTCIFATTIMAKLLDILIYLIYIASLNSRKYGVFHTVQSFSKKHQDFWDTGKASAQSQFSSRAKRWKLRSQIMELSQQLHRLVPVFLPCQSWIHKARFIRIKCQQRFILLFFFRCYSPWSTAQTWPTKSGLELPHPVYQQQLEQSYQPIVKIQGAFI